MEDCRGEGAIRPHAGGRGGVGLCSPSKSQGVAV